MAKRYNLSRSRIYIIWRDMKARCYKTYCGDYKFYGAKGSIVCGSWHDFRNFYADMKEHYTDEMTIDRIDETKGYSKDNCRWLLMSENVKKKSRLQLLKQSTLEGIRINLFNSQREASLVVKVSQTLIGKVIRGERKKAANSLWKLLSIEESALLV